MLKSMTGFGVGDCETAEYKVHTEVKTVNQRYLDVEIHAPHSLSALEIEIRKLVKKYIARGKADVYLTVTDKRPNSRKIRVDKDLAIAYYKALNDMSDCLHLTRTDDVIEIAKCPDVLQVEETENLTAAREVIEQALQQSLEKVSRMREEEGRNLEKDFSARLDRLRDYVKQLQQLAPEITAAYRERLQKVMTECLAGKEPDETRLIQEVAVYADKVNYTEEIVRLESHFAQFEEIVGNAAEPVGRKLDFLVQEMNREINTAGSKANSAAAAKIVVAVKSEIEKIREQLQNIE